MIWYLMWEHTVGVQTSDPGYVELQGTRMNTLYELVEWEDFGFNLPQSLPVPKAMTIAEAVSNIRSAGAFVVAVENGVRRALTIAEELEFQSAYRERMSRMLSSAA